MLLYLLMHCYTHMHKHTLLTCVVRLLFDMFKLLVINLVWREEQRKMKHVAVKLCLNKMGKCPEHASILLSL